MFLRKFGFMAFCFAIPVVSLIKYFNLPFGISPINICYLVLLPWSIYHLLSIKRRGTKLQQFINVYSLALFAFLLLRIAKIAWSEGSVVLTDVLYLFMPFVGMRIFSMVLSASEKSRIMIRSVLVNFMAIISIIAWIQYFFVDTLADAFTELPNLVKEVEYSRYTRELEEMVIYRPNGLIGNPINLGFLLNLFVFLLLNNKNHRLDRKNIVLLASSIVMIFLLASRANILLLLGQIALRYRMRIFSLRNLLPLLFFIMILVNVDEFRYTWVHVFNRFSGEDDYAVASNAEHIRDYYEALYILVSNPVMGVSPNFVFEFKIITDGALFFLALINGIPFSLFSSVFIVSIIREMWLKGNSTLVGFIVLVVLYSFLNSSMIHKQLMQLFFCVAALSYSESSKIL